MKYLNKIIEYGLYLLVFLLPLQARWIIRPGFTEYQTRSLYGTDILLILLLAMFILVIASDRRKRSNLGFVAIGRGLLRRYVPRNDRVVWLLIAGLIMMSGVSVFFAISKPLAAYKFGWLILGAGLFWILAKAAYDRVKLVWSLLLGLALQSLLAVWQFLTQETFANKWLGMSAHQAADLAVSAIETAGADGVGERWLRSYGGFDHPNILGGVMAVGILLLVGEIVVNNQYPISNIQTNSKFKIQNSKIIFWIFLVLFSAALFFSFSRAAWLALGAGLAALLAGAVVKKNLLAQKNILQAVLVSGLVFFILFFQFPNLVMTRLYGGARLENKSVSERLESMKNSLPIIKKNWAGGTGIGNYILALERGLPERESYVYQPAHNVYLLVFSELGALGLILFLGLIFVIARRPVLGPTRQFLVKLRVREIASFPSVTRNDNGAAVSIALVVLLSLDHWLWSLHFGVLFFWLVIGLAYNSARFSRS
ncbi:MAG: O-antigen ligase family protein [bacterium]|nr:O-antigen ligase family protein [bacterium]